MQSPEQNINRIWDIAVFLQMMAAFCNDIDFYEYKTLMLDFHELIKDSDEQKINTELSIYERQLTDIANSIIKKYPLKRNYREIAKDWNEKHKLDKEVISNGVMIGWLEKQIDLTNYYWYDYTPYHFKVGLVIHKGRGEIEENFLLQDSFTCFVKAEKGIKLLDNFGNGQKEKFKSQGKNEFDKETLDKLNALKYEVSFYSRMTIISFYSFLECFVNSLGFDYYYRNEESIDKKDAEILRGSKNGRFLNLKCKIEKYQKILRADKSAKIILSDDNQIKEPFKSLFDSYEELRNSSVHYSPEKLRIWLKPHDWFNKAKDFSVLVIEASIQIWKSCHETSKGPDYLGRLEYDRLYKMAKEREEEIREIEKNWL
ncbi:MAG TPA: hypothetical protein PLC80_15565 [Draconibacterium sp.]|nr:hypothetical protein [Draconibacterium sp.]